MKILILGLTLALSTLHISSCSTQPLLQKGMPSISLSDYENLVESKTKKIESYSGLTNQLNVSATKIDSQMNEALLARSAQIYEWNGATFQEEKTKNAAVLAAKTEFFISFYTPERQHNNLNSSKSIWKIYLDIDGNRFEGKATKLKAQLVDIQSLYPHHTRFGSPYKIEFFTPTNTIENKPVTLTFTGPNASVKLIF